MELRPYQQEAMDAILAGKSGKMMTQAVERPSYLQK